MQPEKLTNSGENYQNHGEIKIDHKETVLPNPEIKEPATHYRPNGSKLRERTI